MPRQQRHDLLRGTHHHNPSRIVEQTAIALDGLAMGLALVTPGSVPEESKEANAAVMREAYAKIGAFLAHEMNQCVTATCNGCGKPIEGRADRRWCSSACRQRAYRHRVVDARG